LAEIVLLQCDGCGKQDEKKNAKSWITAEFDVGSKGKESGHFCSFACVGRYATRREDELNPDHG
jgi:hypothetical protein